MTLPHTWQVSPFDRYTPPQLGLKGLFLTINPIAIPQIERATTIIAKMALVIVVSINRGSCMGDISVSQAELPVSASEIKGGNL